ncbi:MAG: iron-containing alcohol dehydrogenase, partial [Mangrovicoccus sp.]|nr:iron-containing alcohol dehydrogenase [Mangrovicoccus sp.]
MPDNQIVPVELGARSYEVVIGPGLIAQAADQILPLLARPRVAIITDDTVGAHHLKNLTQNLDAAGIASSSLTLPAGEATKNWEHLNRSVEWLLDEKIERRDVVIALGGGVIGDLVGFASSILRRGVRFVQIPTSLLAQVDSSVGGKTGINSRHGK